MSVDLPTLERPRRQISGTRLLMGTCRKRGAEYRKRGGGVVRRAVVEVRTVESIGGEGRGVWSGLLEGAGR